MEHNYKFLVFLLLSVVLLLLKCCDGVEGLGKSVFGFEIHDRYSDKVKGVLSGYDEFLPEKGSLEYHKFMRYRDHVKHGRRLLSGDKEEPLTFGDGNETYRFSSLGFLHYADVSLGTPSMSFLVALDTGSDLFWVPCNCTKCVKALIARNGDILEFNIYSPSTSNTSTTVPCDSNMCEYQGACSKAPDRCPYQVKYLSKNTSSTGILVEDVLHLTAEDNYPKVVDARITFGCGEVQTGLLLEGGAPNGLFGLGVENSSVPSILSSAGLIADSFSMCFGDDGSGRISFGDKGSLDQKETPFSVNDFHPTYNISVTQISVGKNHTVTDFNAIFDSGTSYTYLNDPVYTLITENFNSQVLDKRHPSNSSLDFEFCYDVGSKQKENGLPNVTLTMKGGSDFPILEPVVFRKDENGYTYCLGVVKSFNINIIGQNFMTGNRIVFDREKLVLGWKQSNCDSDKVSTSLPISPTSSKAVPPATAVQPNNNSPQVLKETGADVGSDATSYLNSIRCTYLIMVLAVLVTI